MIPPQRHLADYDNTSFSVLYQSLTNAGGNEFASRASWWICRYGCAPFPITNKRATAENLNSPSGSHIEQFRSGANFDGDSDHAVVAAWIDAHMWTRPTLPETLLFVDQDHNRSTFSIQSGFSYLQVNTTYAPSQDDLTALTVSLNIPSYGTTVLVESDEYALYANKGPALSFEIGDGVIHGNISFYYSGEDSEQDVYMDYYLNVPFDSKQDGTVSLFPVPISGHSSLGRRQTRAFPNAAKRANDQELLLTFLDDFAADGNRILVETYYPRSNQKAEVLIFDISFGPFTAAGTIDPTFATSAELYLRPSGSIRLAIANLVGSLSTGVSTNVESPLAKGTAVLSVAENSSGLHDLYIDLNLTAKLIGPVQTGKFLLTHLQF